MNAPDSGQFDVRKLRGSGIWLPLSVLTAVVLTAVAWGTNVNRLSTLEQQQVEDHKDRARMEEHIENDDREIAVLKDRLLLIIEQLRDVNSKLDRAEEERRK